jgi:hypothetical protein
LVGQDWQDLDWWQGGEFALVSSEQDPLAFLPAQPMGHLAATGYAAVHAFPITGELPPSFTGAGTSSDPFLKDLQGLLAIVRGR